MNILDEFVKELSGIICASNDPNVTSGAQKLIKKNTKNLQQGHYSFPELTKVWTKYVPDIADSALAPFKDGNSLKQALPVPIANIRIKSDYIFLRLNKEIVFKKAIVQFIQQGNFNLQNETLAKKKVRLINTELGRTKSDQLTQWRCNQAFQLSHRLLYAVGVDNGYPGRPDHTIDIGCSEKKEGDKILLKVGTVLDPKSGKKNQDVTFAEFYRDTYRSMERISMERENSHLSEKRKLENLHVATIADIQFYLLSTSLQNSISKNPGYPATFILYNYARLIQIFRIFEEREDKYGALPNVSDIDFGLLTEDEEWELIFTYILGYPEVIHSSVSDMFKGRMSGIKLCQFLLGISNVMSRYYNRVKILRDPTPALKKIMFARLYLLKAVQMTVKHALAILDIPVLSFM